MKFRTGPKSKEITYIVIPTQTQLVNGRDRPVLITNEGGPPLHSLRAEFRNHFFDSEEAAAKYGWNEHNRRLVEQHLQEHPDFRRHGGHGIYLADPDAPAEMRAPEARPATVCIAVILLDGGDTRLCGRPVNTEGELCAEHVESPDSLEVALDEPAEVS